MRWRCNGHLLTRLSGFYWRRFRLAASQLVKRELQKEKAPNFTFFFPFCFLSFLALLCLIIFAFWIYISQNEYKEEDKLIKILKIHNSLFIL